MTLLHVLGSDSMGGCERLSVDLATYYAQQNDRKQAALFYGQVGEGPAWQEFRKLGVEIFAVPYEGKKASFVSNVRRVCKGLKVRHVLTHGLGMHLLIAAGAKMAGATRIIALVGNPPPADPRVLARTRRRAHAARPLVDFEVACSHYVRERMITEYQLPPKRVRVIHNWVRFDDIARRAEASRLEKASSPESEQGPVIVMVARLDPIKDHVTVIHAIAILRRAFPNIRLRLVGDGPMRKALESLASDLDIHATVEFVGAREDIPEQLGRANLFVYGTTPDEGFGIVLAEAMAAKLPIVCTDIGPCREVLNQGKAGHLVEAANPKAIAQAVQYLLQNPEAAEQMASLGQHYAKSNYCLFRAAKKFDLLLGG